MKFLLQKSCIVLFVSLWFTAPSITHAVSVSDYRVVSFMASDAQKNSYVVIRSFLFGREQEYLVVNPSSLATAIIAAKKLSKTKIHFSQTSAYGRALKKFTSPPYASA